MGQALRAGAVFRSEGRYQYMPGVRYEGPKIGFRRQRTGVLLNKGDDGYDFAHPDDKADEDDSSYYSESDDPVADGSSPICVISLNNVLVPGHGHACKGLLEIGRCVNTVTLNSDRFRESSCKYVATSDELH